MLNIHNPAVEAAAAFLKKSGYDVIDAPQDLSAVGIVAHDGSTDEIVFVTVQLSLKGEGFPPAPGREKVEADALAWLADHDSLSGKVRFDCVSLVIANATHALVRHHVNAYGNGAN